jgi:translocator protein
MAAFWRIRPLAGALLVPYLLWVSFAAALTWSRLAAEPGAAGLTCVATAGGGGPSTLSE